MKRKTFLGVLALGLSPLLAGAADWGLKTPTAVSPGEVDRVVAIESRCPVFSWGAVEGAAEYELAVYRLGEEGESAELALRQSFAGSARGWTPSLDRCLERGERYGWSVRAVGADAASGWSLPHLFRVDAGPSLAELEEALRVAKQRLETGVVGGDDMVARAEEPPGHSATGRPVAGLAEAEGATAPASAVGVAALTIAGEVRTVDSSDAPRIWGQGRPGTEIYIRLSGEGGICSNAGVKFGLSYATAEWGSAGSACPAGTWVCTWAERGTASCDTARPDSTMDRFLCDGESLDDAADDHLGWVADEFEVGAVARRETSPGNYFFPACESFPVWCCWE